MDFFRKAADSLFPARCFYCGMPAGPDFETVCGVCAGRERYLSRCGEALCPRCSLPLAQAGPGLCYECAGGRDVRNISLFSCQMHPLANGLLHSIKFDRHFSAGRDLAALLKEGLGQALTACDGGTLVAVPSSPAALKRRGFNPVSFILEQAGICSLDLLRRRNSDSAQKELGRAGRRYALQGLFSVRTDCEIPPKIILVDDVFTTGSTAQAVCGVLREAGCRDTVSLSFFRDEF